MPAQQPYPPLPESFIFGVATADHQCEAYEPDYQDIRDIWEQRRHLTARGRATDFWNRYSEDIQLARDLGCKAFRFSLAWSRLEPASGQFNEEAFAHYQQLIEAVHAAGMEPVMTLHHFTWPVHVEKRGGLIGEDFSDIFTNYVTEVVNRLGQQVRYWITFNEPSQLVYGYIKPWWQRDYFVPPGLPGVATLSTQLEAIGKLMRNLFLAHTHAREVIKQSNAGALVGVNPMLLGLPVWLQRLVDRNITKLRSWDDWLRQGRHFAERALLEHGKVDAVMATLTMTSERDNQVDFSEVYFVTAQKVLVQAGSPVNEPQDVSSKTVAVVKGSTAESSISAVLPGAGSRMVNSYAEALQALDSRQVVAILADDTILRGLMEQYPDRYRMLNEQLTTEPYAVAIAKGNPELLEAVDGAVRRFKSSGDWAASFARNFPGQPVPQPPELARRETLADISGIDQAQSPEQHAGLRTQRKTVLDRIKKRGYLVVAVKEDVPGFGYRDPETGQWSGLEIDLARAITQDIFGDPSKVVFRPVQDRERLLLLRSALRIFDPLLKGYSILSTAFISNWWHLGMAGKLPDFLCPPECIGQQDFVSFDYYWGISTLQLHRLQQLMDAAAGKFDLAPVWPEALYGMLKYHAQLFPEKEILIIENGCVDEADGVERAKYISRHMQEVQRARRDGVNVVAYICWSITSNREWGLKFGPGSNFGLYHIELDTDPELKRVPTAAVGTYRKIIEQHSVS
jgi:beta-glucosidase/6-phospho-beta-glucosidase/beta-galactosidase/ABC-type amino acid transport substrate-binding protein